MPQEKKTSKRRYLRPETEDTDRNRQAHPLDFLANHTLARTGQLIIGQRLKSIFFFLGSLYIYLIAIPYSLGYGNYRGDGIAGLSAWPKAAPASIAPSSS